MRLTAAALILFVSTGFVPQDVDVLKDSDASRTKVDRLRDERILSRLATQKITIDLHSVALTEFINQMRSATGLNFAIMHVEDPTVEVSVRLTKVTVRDLLSLALKPVDLGWAVEDGVVMILPTDVLLSRTTLRAYPVGDLTGPLGRLTAKQLVELIKSTVDKDSWHYEGSSLVTRGTTLYVRAQPAVHEKVAVLLESMSVGHLVQLDIEVFFIAVKESTLREIRWGANRIKPEKFADLLKTAEEGKEAALLSAGEVVCFDGQKASAFGGTETADPSKSGGVRDGTLIEVRPTLLRDRAVVLIDLNAVHATKLVGKTGMKVYRIGTTVRAPLDQYVIAGGVGEYGEKNRRVVIIVRAAHAE